MNIINKAINNFRKFINKSERTYSERAFINNENLSINERTYEDGMILFIYNLKGLKYEFYSSDYAYETNYIDELIKHNMGMINTIQLNISTITDNDVVLKSYMEMLDEYEQKNRVMMYLKSCIRKEKIKKLLESSC